MNIQNLTARIVKTTQDELDAKLNRLACFLDLVILQNKSVPPPGRTYRKHLFITALRQAFSHLLLSIAIGLSSFAALYVLLGY